MGDRSNFEQGLKKKKKKKTGRMISSRHGTSTKAAKLDQCDQ